MFSGVICGVILALADVTSVGENSGWAFHLGGVDIHTNILAHTYTHILTNVDVDVVVEANFELRSSGSSGLIFVFDC